MFMVSAQATTSVPNAAGNYTYFKLIPLVLGAILVYQMLRSPESFIRPRAGVSGRIQRMIFDALGEEEAKMAVRFVLAPFTIIVLAYYIVLPLLGLR